MRVKAFLLSLCYVMAGFSAAARELTDLQVEVTSTKRGPEAKQEAFERATEEGSRQLMEQLLGSDRAGKLWPQVASKVLKNSTRYVLFIKGSAPQELGTGTKIQVQIRLSPDNLEALLRELGALGGGTVRLLPLVYVNDVNGSKYVWWADIGDEKNPSSAKDYFKRVLKLTTAHFKSKNVYLLDPASPSFRNGVPASYRMEGLRREDQALLAQYLKADVILSGKVDLVKPRPDSVETRVDFALQLWQPRTGRVIAEGVNSEVVPVGSAKAAGAAVDHVGGKLLNELAGKLAETVASGSLNLNIVRLSIVGPLGYKHMVEFRRQLANVRDIQALKERLFEPHRVTFEVETSVSGQELAKLVERTSFSLFKVDVENIQDDGLVLSVKPLSSAQ
jgi:enamine deaminase RidA (YjgF/YER057c/UK114 family)